MWSKLYSECQCCSSTDYKHMAKGYCNQCYLRLYRNSPDNRERIKLMKNKWRQENYEYCLQNQKRNRESKHFNDQRDPALQRDQNLCVKCNTSLSLVVHHLDGKGRGASSPNNDIQNLMTLCRSCHINEHRELLNEARKKNMEGKWSRNFDCCKECGTTERKHGSHGLCVNCYARYKRSKRGI